MTFESPLRRKIADSAHRLMLATCACVALFCSGCQTWPGTTAMKQYQLESDRLLSEFRAQKKRADELDQRNVQLEQRLGESEKLIARLQGRSSSRVADTRSRGRELIDIPAEADSSGRRLPGPGLPDASTNPSARLSSGPVAVGQDLGGDPARANQWRPIPGR